MAPKPARTARPSEGEQNREARRTGRAGGEIASQRGPTVVRAGGPTDCSARDVPFWRGCHGPPPPRGSYVGRHAGVGLTVERLRTGPGYERLAGNPLAAGRLPGESPALWLQDQRA